MTLLDYWNIATEVCGTTRTVLTLLVVALFFIVIAIFQVVAAKYIIAEAKEIIKMRGEH